MLAEGDKVAVPYLVSAKCLIDGEYSSYGEATLHHLNTIRLVDSYGRLQQAVRNLTISGNVVSDQPMPSSNSKVYFFKANLIQVPDTHRNVYAPKRIISMTDTGNRFEEFLSFSEKEREELLEVFR